MAKITIDSYEIYYELAGPAEAPVVMLANGIFADTTNWALQTQALSKRFQVLRFDFPGQGKSTPANEPISPAQQAQFLTHFLRTLEIEQVNYLGVSYGGEVGLTWAITQPKVLQKLILADCVARIDASLAARVEAWVAVMRIEEPDLLFQVSAPDIFSPLFMNNNKPLMDLVRKSYKNLNLKSLLNLLHNYQAFDIYDQLNKIKAPTLLLCGELDTLKTPAMMTEIQNQVPNAEFLVVPGAGHALHMEKPNEFLSCVFGFLSKHENRTAGAR